MSDQEIAELEARVRWLERCVDVLSSVPGTPSLPPRPGTAETRQVEQAIAGLDIPQEVLDHLVAGRDIQAVKAYQDATGAKLKVAKRFVDEAKQRLG